MQKSQTLFFWNLTNINSNQALSYQHVLIVLYNYKVERCLYQYNNRAGGSYATGSDQLSIAIAA